MRRLALVVLLSLGFTAPVFANAIDTYFDAKRAAERGDFDKALELYSQAINSGTLRSYHMVGAYNARGLIYFYRGEQPSAIADFTKALEYEPDSALILRNRCMANFAAKNTEAAKIDCEDSAAIDPGSAAAFETIGFSYLSQKLYNLAIENFDQSIEIDPSYGFAYLHRGITYYRLGDKERGRADLIKAGELMPNNRAVQDTLASYGLTF